MPRKRNKQTCSCGKQFIPRKRYFGVPEGGWLCGVHGPSGIAARSSGYSCGLPESSGSSTGTDADVSEVAGAVSSGDVATSDVGVTEESSAALTGTGADVCASPPVSRRKRGRVATGGTPVRAPPNSSEIDQLVGPDHRIVCLTIKRPDERDGRVVEFHWAASCVVTGNTAFLK
jgi:hypothetical protein